MDNNNTTTTPAEAPATAASTPVQAPQTLDTAKLDAPSILSTVVKDTGEIKTEVNPEAKTDAPETKEGEVKEDVKAEGDKPVVPEKYEFKLPDGFVLDETANKFIDEVIKPLGVPQEKAQALVDEHIRLFNQSLEAKEAQAAANWKTEVEGWAKQIKEDPDMGGQKYDETVAYAGKAIRATVAQMKHGKAFTELLEGGLGNHPAMVELFMHLGKSMSEDTPVKASTDTSEPKSFLKELYPSMKK